MHLAVNRKACEVMNQLSRVFHQIVLMLDLTANDRVITLKRERVFDSRTGRSRRSRSRLVQTRSPCRVSAEAMRLLSLGSHPL